MKKLSRLWNGVSSIGLKEDMPFELKKRITLSNHFGIAIFFLASIFSFLYIVRSLFVPMPLMVLALVGLTILVFNRMGANILSRFLVSISPSIALLMLNVLSKLSNPERIESFHYTNVRLLIAVTVLLPLTVFTIKEKKAMIAAAAIPLGIAFFLDPIFNLFGVGSEMLGIVSVYKKTAIDDLVVLLTTLFLTFIFLMRLNKQLQERNMLLLDNAENTNQMLQKQQQDLQENLKEIEVARKEEEQRSHIAMGLSHFSEQIRAENNIEQAYRKLLTTLIQFVDASQGGLYINEEDEKGAHLKLKACYAYGRQKYLRQNIEPGDGLIGQCFLEKESTLLHAVPEGYVNITSGLGQANPTCIFIMPLLSKDNVVGVMEFASFKTLTDKEAEYLNKAGEHLASAIDSSRIHVKTQKLLQDSKKLSGDLLEKENEMRQNVEELQATQESMARKEAEYLDKIAALKKQLEKKSVETE